MMSIMTSINKRFALVLLFVVAFALTAQAQQYDVIIRGGTIYDGSGAEPIVADIALRGDRIARIGQLSGARAMTEINAKGLSIAPGFINMMSGPETLFAD